MEELKKQIELMLATNRIELNNVRMDDPSNTVYLYYVNGRIDALNSILKTIENGESTKI